MKAAAPRLAPMRSALCWMGQAGCWTARRAGARSHCCLERARMDLWCLHQPAWIRRSRQHCHCHCHCLPSARRKQAPRRSVVQMRRSVQARCFRQVQMPRADCKTVLSVRVWPRSRVLRKVSICCHLLVQTTRADLHRRQVRCRQTVPMPRVALPHRLRIVLATGPEQARMRFRPVPAGSRQAAFRLSLAATEQANRCRHRFRYRLPRQGQACWPQAGSSLPVQLDSRLPEWRTMSRRSSLCPTNCWLAAYRTIVHSG